MRTNKGLKRIQVAETEDELAELERKFDFEIGQIVNCTACKGDDPERAVIVARQVTYEVIKLPEMATKTPIVRGVTISTQVVCEEQLSETE